MKLIKSKMPETLDTFVVILTILALFFLFSGEPTVFETARASVIKTLQK